MKNFSPELRMQSSKFKIITIIIMGVVLVGTMFFNAESASKIQNLVSFNTKTNSHEMLDLLLGDMVGLSKHQKDYDPEVIFKTLKFMVQDIDEYDPELISFVRSMIIKLDRRYTLPVSIKYGDLEYVDKILASRVNGFYIEAGAFDPVAYSNSLFFEVNRNCTGILIEPLPWFYDKIKKADRNAYILNACIAKKKPLLAKFRIDHWGSGIENQMPEKRIKEIDNTWKQALDKSTEKYIIVPCFSLNTIMTALGVNRVDFFSLDVEGGELEVVRSLDYDKLSIELFQIETLHGPVTKPLIVSHLTNHNYTLIKDSGVDVFLHKKI